MKSACLFLVVTTGLTAQTAVSLKVVRGANLLVLTNVFLNGAGPFRMAIDTGNASSLIRREVARRIHARPVYAVEQVTAAGVTLLPVVLLDSVTTGALTEHSVEAMVGDVRLEALDGILGQSWLARHDYLLDYRNSLLVLDEPPPDRGLMLPLHSAEGRPSFTAKVDGREAKVVLDSGASTVVLFDCAPQPRLRAALLTNSDTAEGGEATARIALPGFPERKMRAVCFSLPDHPPALLPASVFSAVFVSNRDAYLRLVR